VEFSDRLVVLKPPDWALPGNPVRGEVMDQDEDQPCSLGSSASQLALFTQAMWPSRQWPILADE
ncbi:unnamed protein product, partial [Polarella glacialis]